MGAWECGSVGRHPYPTINHEPYFKLFYLYKSVAQYKQQMVLFVNIANASPISGMQQW